MNKSICLLILMVVSFQTFAQQAKVSKEVQIKTALMAAPADKRDSASVYSYSDATGLILLRQGTNELVCLTDDPAKPAISVTCYHRDLEPFMTRGRELRKQGKNMGEVFDIREQEVKDGKLKMPKIQQRFLRFQEKMRTTILQPAN